MSHVWIGTVLEDLVKYARENKLDFLERDLRITMVRYQYATSEMGQYGQRLPVPPLNGVKGKVAIPMSSSIRVK